MTAKVQCGALAILTVAGLAACGGGSSSTGGSGSSSGPIVIGYAVAKTGGFSAFDSALLNGATIAANDINAKGGVLGRQLKIISADTQSTLTQSAPTAQQLINQGAQFMGATSDYDFGGPALRAAGTKGLAAIGFAGDTRLGYHGIGPTVFNIYQGSPAEGVVMAQFAYEKGWRHPYLLTDTINSYPATVSKGFEDRWKSLSGSDVTGKDLFLNSDQSIATQVSRIQSAKPDVILVASFPPGGASAIRQIRAAGITAAVVGDIAFDGNYWLSSVPDLTNMYVPEYAIAGGSDPSPARKKFFDDYQKLTGQASSLASYPALGYAQVQVLAKGIQDANSTDGKAVAAAISKLSNFDSIVGPINYTWRANCNVPASQPFQILQIQHGQESYLKTETPSKVPTFVC